MRLELADGGEVLLTDMLARDGSWDEVNRNVCRVDANGRVLWRIGTRALPEERAPYTNIWLTADGRLKAYCWIGSEHTVDIYTGEVDAGELVR